MDGDHYNEFIGKRFIGFSILATLVVWVALTWLLTPFVPTETMPWVYIWSAFTATPIAGVFFFALHMFWLVAMEHRKARRSI
jgi:hypothetical protein